MKTTIAVIAAGLICWCSAAASAAPPARLDDASIDQLVESLSDESYQVREAAGRELLERGEAAEAALQSAAASADPEMRFRSRRLLAQMARAAVEQRLQAFLQGAAPDNRQLPGAERLLEIVGDSQASRELYASMLRREDSLLQTLAAADGIGADVVRSRVRAIHPYSVAGQSRVEVRVETVAAVLLVASHSQSPVTPEIGDEINNALSSAIIRSALHESGDAQRLKKLLGAWILRGADAANAYRYLHLAFRYDLAEPGRELARSILRSSEAPTPYALLALGKFGTRDDIPLLESQLENKRESFNFTINNEHIAVQVREIALAMLLELTDQRLQDYGYENPLENEFYGYAINTLYLKTDARREAGIQKWRNWANEHLKDNASLHES